MRPIVVVGVVVCLTLPAVRAFAQSPAAGAPPETPAAEHDVAPADTPSADAKDKDADAGAHALEVTGYQCELLSLGRAIRDLPADAQVDAISFTDPPPLTFRLPDQRREALTECSLRASGLAVRVDPNRKAIILLPRDAGSTQLPNPKIRISLKLAGEPPKSER